jgi:spermidine synthase
MTPHQSALPLVRLTLYLVFFASGAAALIYQVAWQRVLSFHAGMDLFSVTTVVAAFMAGLGIGNLLGGSIADRLTPRRAVLLYAVAELLISTFGWLSIWLLYTQYPTFSPYIRTTASAFLFHFVVLCVPTTLMGTTLPLLSRGVVRQNSEIAPIVGKLYGANTLGAACGSIATAGWWILARVGLEGAVQFAASLNLASGLLALFIMRAAGSAMIAQGGGSEAVTPPSTLRGRPVPTLRGRPVHWIVIYGLTGFIALALEIVWFRLLNVLMFSTTYTFSRLLAIYLVFFGLGVMLGSWIAPRVKRPEREFLWLQFAIGVAAVFGPLLVASYMSVYQASHRAEFRNFIAPILVLAPPTLLMGLSFPLIQRIVTQNVETLGQRTGALLFANTTGAVLGTILTGFLFLDVLGTPATLLVLCSASMLLGLYAAVVFAQGRGRVIAASAIVIVGVVAIVTLPKGAAFWAGMHGTEPAKLTILEDGTCVTALVEDPPNEFALEVGGEPQNSIPFSDFHIRLGAVPTLLHPSPRDVLVIGLGAGSTLYGARLDSRVGAMECVEICAGQVPLLRGLRRQNVPEMNQLFSDPRIRLMVQDGRKFLLDTASRYDVIMSDTLLPRSAYSGSLYSVEFYELVRRHLKPGGLFAQWVASARTLKTAAHSFPYVYVLPGGSDSSDLFVAGNSPIVVDPKILLRRFAYIKRDLRPDAYVRLGSYLQTAIGDTSVRNSPINPKDLNRDLFPRDEYRPWPWRAAPALIMPGHHVDPSRRSPGRTPRPRCPSGPG